MKTLSRDAWIESQRLWAEGEFSDEWKPWRHLAAMKGNPFPPTGTKWDSWEDDDPSDRAMLIRAIRETPELLRKAINRAKSWPEVVAYVIRQRDDWSEELANRERETARRKAADDPEPKQAAMTLKAIMSRISDS